MTCEKPNRAIHVIHPGNMACGQLNCVCTGVEVIDMRTLSLILLCLVILAPSASARSPKDDSTNSKTTTQSSSDSKDKQTSYKPSSETKSSPGPAYHPSSPERSTPREDPPRPIVRSEPKPEPPAPKIETRKPAEDTSRKSDTVSYKPSKPEPPAPKVEAPKPEPAKYVPPTPPASDNKSSNSNSGKVGSNTDTKRPEKAAEASVQPAPQPAYHPSVVITRSKTEKPTPRVETPKNAEIQPIYQPKPIERPASAEINVPVTTTETSYHPSSGPAVINHRTPATPDRNADKREAELQRNGRQAQEKGQLDVSKPAYKPASTTGYTPSGQTRQRPDGMKRTDMPAPTIGYVPSGQVDKATAATKRSGRPSGRTNGPGGYRPTHAMSSYTPAETYSVGYHPGRSTRPHGYIPPALKDGRWQYSTPPFVEDRRWHHPRARFTRPCYYGHWATEYYPGFSWRSCYFYFGIYPFIEAAQVRECPQETIEFVSEPIYVSGSSYVYTSRWDKIDEAMADIRSAWIAGRFDLLQQHVQPQSSIAVLTDGQYDYAISSDDYLSMTQDALAELNTASFVWDKVQERKDGTVMAFAEHSYWSNDRAKTIYVSYTLEKVGRDYFITEVGSSANPLH